MAGFDAHMIFAIQQAKLYARNLAHSFAGFLVVFTCFCMPSQGLTFESSGMKGPKSVLVQSRVNRTEQNQPTMLGSFLLGSVRFFQKQISPIDGPRCSFSPTCSQFGYEAVHDHGPALGIIMTADRLMRCSYWTEAGLDYARLPNGALHDPVTNNLLK
jgi:putative membrane protein insertion efficiency factor